ncbi:MAG TPA: LamG domain-containing protein, partial [Vicinamibacterales bacterium]|nr:LamG domain-containing protein [Vicinamibacterales bacterium]
MGTAPAAGTVGPARAFSLAASDGMIVPGGANIVFSQLTISGWLLVHSVDMANMYSAVITREEGDTNDDDFYLGENLGTPYTFMHTTGSSGAPSGPSLTLERWTHLSATYDGAMARFYIDGVEVENATASGDILTDAQPFDIGCGRNMATTAEGTCDSDYLDGDLDEVRIESVPRSAAWIAYEHDAERDQVITYGPLVAAP